MAKMIEMRQSESNVLSPEDYSILMIMGVTNNDTLQTKRCGMGMTTHYNTNTISDRHDHH